MLAITSARMLGTITAPLAMVAYHAQQIPKGAIGIVTEWVGAKKAMPSMVVSHCASS